MAATLASVILGGCLGFGSGDPQHPPSQAGANIGATPAFADCAAWKEASVRERYGTIGEIRAFAGGPVGRDRIGATLEDDDAYELFDRYCENDFAKRFKLYKLYTRAASFQSERQER